MKNIFKYIGVAAIGCVAFTSCDNDKFLDVTHYSLLDEEAMFSKDENAIKGMTGCYDLMHRRGTYNDDPYKYWIFNGLHPTMDSQASGWDKDFMTQNWTPKNEQLQAFWSQSYACASRCNDFIAGLEKAEQVTKGTKDILKGEALALRGFQFFALANTFGRVPLLITGENYNNTPSKPRAASFEEMWDFVIKDFKEAAELLNWEPFDGLTGTPQYGRCTKGMALTFLGDAYMWKAFTCPEKAQECYKLAYDVFDQVIKSKTYELAPSYSTLYDADEAWPKEAIWQIVLNSGDSWGSWNDADNAGARGWTGFYFGPTSNGAWGTYQMSYELYDCFENYLNGQYAGSFDKRRDASMVCATIPAQHWIAEHPTWEQHVKPTEAWLKANVKYLRGYKEITLKNKEGKDSIAYVFDQEVYDKYDWAEEGGNGKYDPLHPIGFNPFNQEFVGWCGFHWASSDPAPTVYSTKHWRNGRGTDWGTGCLWCPDHIYFKRYANVLLDQAECCFRLGKADEGWGYIDMIRERAFGNLEVGKDASKFLVHHNKVAAYFGDSDGKGSAENLTEYPLAFNKSKVAFPSAKEYYTALKAEKGYKSEAWLVALGLERRKEFNAEPYLRSDLHKSGFLEDHINVVYPKNSLPQVGASVIKEWHTARDFDFDMNKMFMPIPQDEITKNSACDQNPGY